MKNKVLKLCKRLNKVTASEIAPILMITEAEAREILNELVNEGSLTVRGDLVYFYKEIQTKPTLPLFFEFREQKEIELLLKCFCAEVPTEKTIWITEIGINIVNKFNSYFRKLIYEKQLKELVKLFDNNPQMAKERTFLGKLVYMYYYNNKVFVSAKNLQNLSPLKPISKNDVTEFKKVYLKLTRRIYHNSMYNLIHYHLAEQIFRLEHSYDDIYEEIKSIMYNHT